MKLNEKAAVNNRNDRYTKNWSIQVYGNEHGEGHMEVNISGIKYYVLIPTVQQWNANKTFIPHITATKTHIIPRKYIEELIIWADDYSIQGSSYEYTNLEYCRFMWNFRNTDNIHKTLVIFSEIKDISSQSTKNTKRIGNIEVEVLKQNTNYMKFIYNNSTYEYNYGYIAYIDGDNDETEFLQNVFDENY
jgi:hypothetical protein